jgi:hypothetical protein
MQSPMFFDTSQQGDMQGYSPLAQMFLASPLQSQSQPQPQAQTQVRTPSQPQPVSANPSPGQVKHSRHSSRRGSLAGKWNGQIGGIMTPGEWCRALAYDHDTIGADVCGLQHRVERCILSLGQR